MKTSELIFVGIKGAVVALNRATGQQVWATNLKGIDLVNVIVENGVVLAACHGEVFCLDPLTGNGIWHNPLRGFGIGLATIAGDNATVLTAKRRRDEEASTAAATTAACA